MNITLRPTTITDLDILFQFQLDPDAVYMAAFTPKDPADKEAYISKYTRLLNDPTINNQTILLDGAVAGSIAKFIMEDEAEITYWIDKQYWGRGGGCCGTHTIPKSRNHPSAACAGCI